MEGYFPIKEYCKLAEVNTDTAYHRVYRNKVPYFTDKDDRMFIYYNSEYHPIPDDFICVGEYAKNHSISISTVMTRIRKKRYKEEDIIQFSKHEFTPHKKARVFIRKDAQMINLRVALCPDGYELCSVWAERNGVSRENLSQMIFHKRINIIKVDRYNYIKKDTEPPLDKRRRY